MNVVPQKSVVSDTLAPRLILTGVKMDFNLHWKIPIGGYDQIYQKTGNYTTDCIVGAICIVTNHNIQGGYKFIVLNTGNTLDRNQFTPCTITQDVIYRVLNLVRKKKGPEVLV